MDEWGKFNETPLPEREKFCSNINIEVITDANYMHARRVCKIFEIENLGDLYLRSNPLLLADLFETFRKMRLEIYEFDPVKTLSAPRLAWQAAIKKTKVELELLTNIDMLLMVGNWVRGAIFNFINIYLKANNKHIKEYNKSKESSYLFPIVIRHAVERNEFAQILDQLQYNCIYYEPFHIFWLRTSSSILFCQ